MEGVEEEEGDVGGTRVEMLEMNFPLFLQSANTAPTMWLTLSSSFSSVCLESAKKSCHEPLKD